MVNNIYHSVSLTPGLGYLTSLGSEMHPYLLATLPCNN